jgi:TonB family protein
MKKFAAIVVFTFVLQQLQAQGVASLGENGRSIPRTNAIEEAAAPANRQATFDRIGQYIAENLRYPELARANGIEGTVVAELSLTPAGKVTGVTLIKTLGFGCDAAVVSLLSGMPDWTPGRQDGQAVAQKVTVPVRFRLR